jgi:hypothetical protein
MYFVFLSKPSEEDKQNVLNIDIALYAFYSILFYFY